MSPSRSPNNWRHRGLAGSRRRSDFCIPGGVGGAFALFGSNRFLSSGADLTITPIFAGSLALLAAAGSPDYAALAGGLALMVGVALVVGGIFRLGWIADLLSSFR